MKEETNDIKEQASEFLESAYYYAASIAYKNLLKLDPNDKEGHLGVLMADNQVGTEEALIKHYQDLYSSEETEIKLAGEKETDSIEEICDRLFVPEYFEKDEIRKLYDFDLSYKSSLFCRVRQKEQILKEIEKNEHLSWLKEKGSKEISDILKAYDKRIDEANELDREKIELIRNKYQRFLYATYSLVKNKSREARQKRENDFQSLIHEYNNTNDIERLKELLLQFEKFNSYKDTGFYIKDCNKKIEDLKKETEDKAFRQSIQNALDQARGNLVTKKFSDAYDGFTKVISMDPENEDAYLGVLMSQAKALDEDELFDYYRNLYDDGQGEVLEACKEDTDHIEEMVRKYALPELLDKETIEENYEYDRTYRSYLNARISQEKQFREEYDLNPAFEWLKKNGSAGIKKKIRDVYRYYEDRVKESEDVDRKKIEEIRSDYQRFLFKTYTSIKKLHKQATNKQEDEYKNIIRSFEMADDEFELREIISRFEDLGEYKDARDYIALCQKKIDELNQKRESENKAQEIETALIAGRAYLSSGDFDMADKTFGRVMSMNEEEPRAYLGILMAETGSRNIDELVDYYGNLYSEDEREFIDGCDEDIEHIEKNVDKYYIPDYLEKDTIRKYYDFDRQFGSAYASRVEQKKQYLDEVKMNPLLAKAASGNDDEVSSFFERVNDIYDKRIEEAKKADEKQSNSIRHIYEVYLQESDKTVAKIYEEKLKKKNEDSELVYQKNLEQFDRQLNEEGLRKLADSFDPEYKDGSIYIEQCNDRIKQIKINREKERLAALLQEGDELLESRSFSLAKNKYESYLAIDPDNEEAHLKLLMTEKRVTDIDALFAFYKGLYVDEILETKDAVEENTDHIDRICEKSVIPRYLEEDEIRKKYVFDRTYESLVNARRVQKQQIEDELEFDPIMSWLNENGSSKVKTYIRDLLNTYDQRVEEAEEDEDEQIRTIEKNYRAFLRNTDKEIRSLYNDLNKKRNTELKNAEKERKEKERRLKEEAERERLLKEEALRQEEEEKQERLRKQRELELEALKKEEQLKEEALKKEEEAKERKRLQSLRVREKEKLEKEASLMLGKERKKQEKQKKDEEARLLKEANKKDRKEREKTPFRLNYTLVLAFVSLIFLGTVLYLYVIVPGNKYKNAVSLTESGDYDEAIEIFKELGRYKDAEYQVKETTYKKADDLYRKKKVIEAANIFNSLRFDDSEDRVRKIKDELLEDAKAGDTVLYGDYEQDGDTENGKELIEWIVLEKEEGKMLLLSKYAIEGQKFNSTSNETYWETSSLRSWLNGRFPDNAFSKEKPSDVLQTTLKNYRYPETDEEITDIDELIPEEYETRDRLFLLSEEDIELYMPEDSERICQATEHAIENGVAVNADNDCNWWLRDPYNILDKTELIVRSIDGDFAGSMYELTNGVRPTMWIKH